MADYFREEDDLLEEVEFDTSNPEDRCACVLLIDTSTSMGGRRIEALNEGLISFQKDIRKDELTALRLEVALVSFGEGGVKVEQDFVTADRFEAPELTTGGNTPMGGAILKALDMIAERKKIYRENGVSYYRPWIFMITDGEPNDGNKWKTAAARIRAEENREGVAFFAVGVEDADMDRLREISVREPVKLKGLSFREMFEWLSNSFQRVSNNDPEEQTPLEPIGWGSV